jgi:transposase-like protein
VARLRFASKMPAFFRLLSQPLPLEEASRRLQIEYSAVSNWLMRFRQLIALHDPDCHWTPFVRLGLKYRPVGFCTKCGHQGELHNGGFSVDERRQVKCPKCAHSWPLDMTSAGGEIPVVVIGDPALNAADRLRRAGVAAPDLPRIGTAFVRTERRREPLPVDSPVVSRVDANRFDFAAPLRHNSPLPRRHVEDKQLTRFLKRHIDRALSDSTEPPPCPHCGSGNTRFASGRRAVSPLPQFQCRACARLYTRTSRTPLAKIVRKDMLYQFLPLLSQHRTLAYAAQQLGTTPEVVKAWVSRFREWLMALDPTGDYESRVRLGLKAPWPVMKCPHCRKKVKARPHGFKKTKTQTAAQLKRRLFRCTGCNGFFDVSIDAL